MKLLNQSQYPLLGLQVNITKFSSWKDYIDLFSHEQCIYGYLFFAYSLSLDIIKE